MRRYWQQLCIQKSVLRAFLLSEMGKDAKTVYANEAQYGTLFIRIGEIEETV